MKKRLCVVAFSAALLGTTSLFAIQGPASAQSLQEEAAQLLTSHPQIRSARQSVASSEEGINAAFAEYLPTVSAFGDFGYERIDSPGRTTATPGQGPFTTGQARQASVTITQTVFNGFLNDADNDNANLAKQSAEISLEEATQNILFEGVSIYLEVLRNLRLIQLAGDNEATIQRQFELEDERVRRGSGITLDVLESKKRLQVAKERRVAFDGALRDSLSRFNQVYGHIPVIDDMIMPTPPLGLVPENIDTAVSAALEAHPAIRNSMTRIDIAQEQRTIAKAAFYPSVDLVAEWSYEDDLAAVRGSRRDYTAKVQANWDLFNGFATRAGVARASHDYLSSIDQSNFVKRKISEETRLAWSGLDTSRKRVTLLQNAVNIAAEVFSGRRKLREAGKETVINVLDAESQMFDARIQLVAAQHDARIAVYRLMAAMGQLNLDTISRLASLPATHKVTAAALAKDDAAMAQIEEIVTSAGGKANDKTEAPAAEVKMAAVENTEKTATAAATPVAEKAASIKLPTEAAPRPAERVEKKASDADVAAFSEAKKEAKITRSESASQKLEKISAKTNTKAKPVKTAAKADTVKAALTPVKKSASKRDAELQSLTSVSALPLRKASYPVDGDPNFIRAWPYE
ncbi:MAG: TolC family protein [Rhodospirillaceae bacterium]|nr:TolC family protein [Rhodospirillaceae bacterium]